MKNKRKMLTAVALLLLMCPALSAQSTSKKASTLDQVSVPKDALTYNNRPAEKDRLFHSTAVEAKIKEVVGQLTNKKLAWMFVNCFPNTIDTTVHFETDSTGHPDTFVYTGDIHAMWLRDSGAQVYPYIRLAKKDKVLQEMLKGVLARQWKCICIDPYANAFNKEPNPNGEWMSDNTDMKPMLHERKYEIDSSCYPLRLAYAYWKETGDASIFTADFVEAVQKIVATFRTQQRKKDVGPYYFLRTCDRALDMMNNGGWGAPVKPCGLIASAFRPSDDATTFLFLIPSNFMAVSSLRKAAEMLDAFASTKQKAESTKNKGQRTKNKEQSTKNKGQRTKNKEQRTKNKAESTKIASVPSVSPLGADTLASSCRALADEVEAALHKYAVYQHPKYGPIYAYEVDGFGNQLLMDDANVPSLLAMPYLGDVALDDPIYQNTRRFVWSDSNPYFFSGLAGEGIGGPHIGYYYIWPMSIIMRAFTSTDDAEIKWCIQTLMQTDGGTGFMHESFWQGDASDFTRSWFAWANTLFGELIIKLIDDGKLPLLNSL